MFNQFTTLQQMQTTIWDFYKDVHGMRPRHFTQQEWDSREFLENELNSLTRIVDGMSSEQMILEGWSDLGDY